MINYLGQHIKNMAELTANLRLLLRKDFFQWTEPWSQLPKVEGQHQQWCMSDVLWLFQASKFAGRGIQVRSRGCFLQEDNHGKVRPVAYASKSLIPAETRYANVEREMLAVVWVCIKFHHYLYGRKFVYQSDHKPLEDIHLKYLSDAPPRLERLLLKLQPYDITTKYVTGCQVPVADVFSRVSPSGRTEIQGLDVNINEITPDLSHIQVETIQQASKEDPILQLLMQQLMDGWPEHVKQVSRDLKWFWQLRDDLSVEHGCFLFQGRLYIPQALRSYCLKTLHQGHPGITKWG